MNINYSINKIKFKVTFCFNKEAYDVSKDLLKIYSDKKILLVVDKNINKDVIKNLYSDLKYSNYKISTLNVNGNKSNKNEKFLFKIIDNLIKKKFTKKSVLISCGGGVVGDVCALAGSLYLRGLIYYHIPTTMTAIVDSCIGGKTGLNYKGIINSVGNYYHPKNVFISKNIINLLPEREYLAGIPEIIKCGLLKNKNILSLLQNKEAFLRRDFKFISKIIYLTLKTKIFFFKSDVFEQNQRLNLNFGHTFAHAIEMALKSNNNIDIIRHGEAVGLGMLCEIFYIEGKSANFYKVLNLLKEYNLPVNLYSFIKRKKTNNLLNTIYNNIFLDKKRVGKFPKCINIKIFGKPFFEEMKNFSRIKFTIKNILF